MQEDQQGWVAQLRAIPTTFRATLAGHDGVTLRHRPGSGEWSAIEVVGHMIDKMHNWSGRVQRVATENRPALPDYDQDASVREHAYQQADIGDLLDQLTGACDHFAIVVERLPSSAFDRFGVHSVNGPMTLRQCIKAPLDSVPAHLEQVRAALASA